MGASSVVPKAENIVRSSGNRLPEALSCCILGDILTAKRRRKARLTRFAAREDRQPQKDVLIHSAIVLTPMIAVLDLVEILSTGPDRRM